MSVKNLAAAFIRLSFLVSICVGLLIAFNFPYHYDHPPNAADIDASVRYYVDAYRKPVSQDAPSEYETRYLQVAETAAKRDDIEGSVRSFVEKFHLTDKTILEIGSGRGYLQDLVDDYTGLDISPSVARFYRKKFVLGSATALPFRDNSFDAIWSIWVLEHVHNPEQALAEARRVIKNGGLLYLQPAWNVPSWVAPGYPVRSYSDLDLIGRLVKLSIPLRHHRAVEAINTLPIRALRSQVATYGPTRLRYHRLRPNYQEYWMPDSDAVNSIDIHEAMLWFNSRGDECLSCGDAPIFLSLRSDVLIVRVKK